MTCIDDNNRYDAYFDLQQAYREISQMCALIINWIAGDVVDGLTTIDRYYGGLLTKEDASKLLERSFHHSLNKEINAQCHIKNLDFFHASFESLCAAPDGRVPKIIPECVNLYWWGGNNEK